MKFITISSKGQITLPIELRKELGLEPQQRLRIHIEDGRIVIQPTGDWRRLAGLLKGAKRVMSDEEACAEGAFERSRIRK